jgi:hypothetical protein
MPTLETRKYNIISKITEMENEMAIQELENFIKKISLELYHLNIIKPLKNDLSVEDIILEQKYNGINRQDFDRLVEELDVKEPIELLIAMI